MPDTTVLRHRFAACTTPVIARSGKPWDAGASVRSRLHSRFGVTLVTAAACLSVVAPATGQTQPPDPPAVTVSLRNEALRVSWKEVPDTDAYDVRWKGPGQEYHGSRLVEDVESPYLIRGLTNGIRYAVQVRASNSAGDSAWSAEETGTPIPAPDRPVVRLTPGNRSIIVTWDAVPGTDDYGVFWRDLDVRTNAGAVDDIVSTSYTIDNLDPGRYVVIVAARNAVGSSLSQPVEGSTLPVLTVADAAAAEGSAVPFVVALSHAAEHDVTVRYRTSDETATADPDAVDGPDYTPASDATLTIDAGDTQETLFIATVDDPVPEDNETFTVTLTSPSSNAVLGTESIATGTILDEDHLGPGAIELCGARVGSRTARTSEAEVDVCWDLGSVVPTGSGVVIEARERYYWDDTEPFNAWNEIARGDTLTACSGTETCVQTTRGPGFRGQAFELELRIRRDGYQLATSPVLRAQMPNGNANALRSHLTRALDAYTGAPIAAPDGPFVVELSFTDPYLHLLLPELVEGLETADFEVANGSVTGVEIWTSGTYKVSVTPTTPGQPVTILLPANRVRGVGEGISGSGANNYPRHNEASNTVVQQTSEARRGDRSVGRSTGAQVENLAQAHAGNPDGEELPVSDRAPRAVGSIPPQVLGVEDADLALDAMPYFADENPAGLTFAAESSDAAVAAVSAAGSLVTVAAVAPGAALVTVTARDRGGLRAEQRFAVQVADRWGRAATAKTVAALGRGYLSSARATLGRRVESRTPRAELTLAGQRIPLDRSEARELGRSLARRLLPPAGSPAGPDGTGHVESFWGDPWTGSRSMAPGSPTLFGGGMSPALGSTRVLMPLGAVSETRDGTPGERRWTVWGQGDEQGFQAGSPAGAPSGPTYDGNLRAAYVGVDVRLNERWLTGLALSRSVGSGEWDADVSQGALTTAMTAVHPYVQWSRDGTTVWALGGIGQGKAENVRAAANGGRETSGLGLGLWLIEARREVAVIGGGVRLGLRGDLSWARLTTESGGETLGDLSAGVCRARVGFEASRAWSAVSGMRVEPFGRLSVRRDGGAGSTGVGLEMELGARVSAHRVRVEAQGRMLALHSAAHYEERGGGVTVSVGEGPQRPGLTVSLAPRWGEAQGSDLLWQEHLSRPFATGAEAEDRSLDARVSYGWRLRPRLLVTPFAGYGSGWGRRRVQLGARLGSLGVRFGAGTPVQIELSGERTMREQGVADHRASLRAVLTFGGASNSRRPE